MMRWHLWVSVVAILAGAFLFSRDTLARFAWEELRSAEIALALVSQDARLAADIGNYYFNGGAYDLDLAARAFRRALAAEPRSPYAWHQLARIEFLRGEFSRALEAINTQIAIHGDALPNSYYVRGLIHGYRGDLDRAAADFQRYLEFDERGWAALNDLAWISFRQGRFSDAEATARRGLTWHPANPWLLTTYGVSLLNGGRRSEAREALTRALRESERLTPTEWGQAYPGNDPRIYPRGLEEMRSAIRMNLELAR